MEEYIPHLIGFVVGVFVQFKFHVFEWVKEKL